MTLQLHHRSLYPLQSLSSQNADSRLIAVIEKGPSSWEEFSRCASRGWWSTYRQSRRANVSGERQERFLTEKLNHELGDNEEVEHCNTRINDPLDQIDAGRE